MVEYPTTLLQALEDWLNHDPVLRPAQAAKLCAELEHVDRRFKRCAVQCYRRIDFPKDPQENPRGVPLPLLDLLRAGRLAESVSSWTTDPSVAKAHLEGLQADATCVIFKHVPTPSEVRVNLSGLVNAPSFQKALQWKYFPAIRYWMTKESEVILEVTHVTPEDVYALGGFAGNVDQLREAAEAEGLSPEEIDRLETQLNRAAGQERWLSEGGSRALALRMAEFARQRYIHPPPVQI
jgi:hypothetical protein